VGALCVVVFFISYLDEIKYFQGKRNKTPTAIYPHSGDDHEEGADRAHEKSTKGLLHWLTPSWDDSPQQSEPMPVWLKVLINLCRPVTYIAYAMGRRKKLSYEYLDAAFTINFIARLLALVGLIVVVTHFFGQVDLSA
jgi:hypothetical protein